MYVLSFEQFIEETWDYVSEYIVTDDYWESNEEFIRELTYALYNKYRKGNNDLTPKKCGNILEGFFVKLLNLNI